MHPGPVRCSRGDQRTPGTVGRPRRRCRRSSEADAAERSEPRYTSNVSGLCDPELQQIATRAISAEDPTEDLRTAQRLLDERSVYLPVYQDVLTTAVSPLVTGVPVTGPVQTGIYGDSALWRQQTGN